MSTRPNSRQNVAYFSASLAASSFSALSVCFVICCSICWSVRSSCSISRETLSDRSSESTTPRKKRRYAGVSFSESSWMSTRFA